MKSDNFKLYIIIILCTAFCVTCSCLLIYREGFENGWRDRKELEDLLRYKAKIYDNKH